jgi:hypothetical protein
MNELYIERERYNFTILFFCISTYRALSLCAGIDSGNSKIDVFGNVDVRVRMGGWFHGHDYY